MSKKTYSDDKPKKARKPRGYKLTGKRSYDYCECCMCKNCDPFGQSPKFAKMVEDRRKKKVCVACASKPCKCKSK